MDTCSVRGETVSQTIVLSFARINVIYLPELGGQLPPPDPPPSRTPMPVTLSVTLSKVLQQLHILHMFQQHQPHPAQFGFATDRGSDMEIALAHDVSEHLIFSKLDGVLPDHVWRLLYRWYSSIHVRDGPPQWLDHSVGDWEWNEE